MKVAFVSDLDARNIRSWSGSTYCMWNGLAKAGADVDLITPLAVPRKKWFAGVGKAWKALGRTYSYRGEPSVLNAFARQVSAELSVRPRPDVIFSCGKPPIAALRTDIPMVFADDGSVPAITRLYPGLNRLTRRCVEQMRTAERGLLSRALLGTYASEWAAEAARREYPESAPKVVSIPWGANIECRRTESDIEDLIMLRRMSREFRVLFIGVDWRRKGGGLVLDACARAHGRGVPIRLDLVGCLPPGSMPDFVHVHGFIAKTNPDGREQIDALYRQAHVLFVPSRAEAYGVVFAEASSYGIPSLSTAVGGIPSVVSDGVNGRLFPPDADVVYYADALAYWWQSPDEYARICRSAFHHYQERLTWESFGRSILDRISQSMTHTRG